MKRDLLQLAMEWLFLTQKSAAVKNPGLAAVTVPKGIDLDAMDGGKSNLIFYDSRTEIRRETFILKFYPD